MLTLQKLEYIADVCSRIRQIKTELQSVYYAYTSPRFDGVKYTNQPADPTSKAFYQAERLHEELEELLRIMSDFETELEQITDHEISVSLPFFHEKLKQIIRDICFLTKHTLIEIIFHEQNDRRVRACQKEAVRHERRHLL